MIIFVSSKLSLLSRTIRLLKEFDFDLLSYLVDVVKVEVENAITLPQQSTQLPRRMSVLLSLHVNSCHLKQETTSRLPHLSRRKAIGKSPS